MKIPGRFFRRLSVYLIGQLILAFGSALAICTDLGISPTSSLPYALSLISGIKLGSCVVAVYGIMLLLQILLLGRKFRPIQLTQLIFSFLFGYFLDFAQFLLAGLSPQTYPARILVLLLSTLIIALGLSLYANAGLINMPPEGLIHTVAGMREHWKFRQVKTVMDCLMVVLAALITFALSGRIQGVGEGTVISALIVGPIMKPVQKRVQPWLDRFLGN